MKILNKIWGISLLALLLIVAAPRNTKAQGDYISQQEFYDELEPYGTWVYDPQYGDVWIPDAEDDFRPYASRGHWVLTEYGNTWVSDYPWGWATFHYGRWRFDDYYGWEWIPGYEWAPAWVSWRQGGGYYGWAPLMPGISISLIFGGRGYNIPDNYWSFAPQAYINRPNIYNYYVPHTRVINIIRNTTVINNTYARDNRRYIAGPGIQDIQRVTHQQPQVYNISNAARPGANRVQNNTISLFRPSVRKTAEARPSRVVDANAYRQQNPDQRIGNKGPGGAAAFNHENASKLANAARTANEGNNVVRVNRGGGNRPNNAPAQPDNRPNQGQNNRQVQPGNNANPAQPDNRSRRPEDRPNIAPPDRAVQPNNNNQQQQMREQRQKNTQQQAERERTQRQAQDQMQKQMQNIQKNPPSEQARQERMQKEQQAQKEQQQLQQQMQQQQRGAQQQQAAQQQQQQAQREQQRQQQQAAQQQQAQKEQQRQQQKAQPQPQAQPDKKQEQPQAQPEKKQEQRRPPREQ